MRQIGPLAGGVALFLSACATTNAPSAAPPRAMQTGDTQSVVVLPSYGIGTSWTSVTDSPLARTAAELSNLGGTPAVAGALGLMLAVDAAPKGRAERVSLALNADIDPAELDADLVGTLDAALPEEIEVDRLSPDGSLPRNSWVVKTYYTLAKDGTAVRVTADIAHSSDMARRAEMQRIARRLERQAELRQQGFGLGRPSLQDRRDVARYRALSRIPPRYQGSVQFHSDAINLPEPDSLGPSHIEDWLTGALEEEREARKRAAADRHAAALARPGSERKRARRTRKADARLERDLAKAERLYEEGIEAARDGEIDKMEQLVLGLNSWTDADSPALSTAIADAQAFIAEQLDDLLSGEAQMTATPELLEQDEERIVMRARDAQGRDLVISTPDAGEAEYGESVARP